MPFGMSFGKWWMVLDYCQNTPTQTLSYGHQESFDLWTLELFVKYEGHETMGLVSNLEFLRINTKSSKFS